MGGQGPQGRAVKPEAEPGSAAGGEQESAAKPMPETERERREEGRRTSCTCSPGLPPAVQATVRQMAAPGGSQAMGAWGV